VFWCFHCYVLNDHPRGPCVACGEPVESPAGLSKIDMMIWALGHPDGDMAVMAARTLGRLRAAESVPALRAAVEASADIFLWAEALLSVISISGPEPLRPWLEWISKAGPLRVREIAQDALRQSPREA
jgi:hypothetical protein